MTTSTTTWPIGLADRIAEAFPEEYTAGLDRMDEEDARALSLAPTMSVRFTEALADPSAEADYGEILDQLCEDAEDLQLTEAPLTDGHAVEGWLTEGAYSAAVWEAESPYLCRASDTHRDSIGGKSTEKTEAA